MNTDNLNLGIAMRPASFADIIGQEDVVSTLTKQIDKGEISRAMMLVGPPGTGKTTLAYIIARAVQGWDFPSDAVPDIIEINAANFRKMDDIRELISQTQSYPMNGKYRVIILDEAQQIRGESQQLLLKPFEEANSANVWIICTTDPEKINLALRTRCATHQLRGFNKRNVHELLVRAATVLERTEPFEDFEHEVHLRGLTSPRAIENAFQNYHNGTDPRSAVMAQTTVAGPEFHEIAMSVVYGDWNVDRDIWGGKVHVVATKTLLNKFETLLKKKIEEKEKEVGSDDETAEVDAQDTVSRPEAARALRAVTAAYLKGAVLKGNAKAAECLFTMANSISANVFDVPMEYPCTIGMLFRINQKMNAK